MAKRGPKAGVKDLFANSPIQAFTLKEVCSILRISLDLARKMIAAGTLKTFRLTASGAHRVTKSEIERIMNGGNHEAKL